MSVDDAQMPLVTRAADLDADLAADLLDLDADLDANLDAEE